MTNEGYLKSLPTEELAKELLKVHQCFSVWRGEFTSWETTDGSLFEDFEQAVEHQRQYLRKHHGETKARKKKKK